MPDHQDSATPPPSDTADGRAASSRRRTVWLPAIAALALLLAAGLAWRLMRGDGDRAAREETTQWTGVAETRAIDLPHGSHVLLGPSSRLTAGPDGHGLRLAGLARLDLARDFTLLAEDVIVRGDSAVLVADAVALEVRIAVLEGTVEVEAPGIAPLLLNAGDRIIVSEVEAALERGVSHDADVAWTERRLVFENEPMRRVGIEVERWYGVRLFVAEELRTHTVTATFAVDDPLEQLLSTVARAAGARFRRIDGGFILEPVEAPPGIRSPAAAHSLMPRLHARRGA